MPTLTTEATVREILEMCYLTFWPGRAEDEVLVANIVRVLEGHDTAVVSDRSSEAFQGVSEYIAEAYDDNLAFGIEVACYIFYSLNRYAELGSHEQRIYGEAIIQQFIESREAYRIK